MEKTISYYEHEAEVARCEVNARNWRTAFIVSMIALVASIIVQK